MARKLHGATGRTLVGHHHGHARARAPTRTCANPPVTHAVARLTEAAPPTRTSLTVHYAQTLDGRIATRTGHSQWISGQDSLRLAHQLRASHQAVMVGVGTVLADNPRLTVRNVPGPSPLRIVVDSTLRLPLDAAVLTDGAAPTLVATTPRAPLCAAGSATAVVLHTPQVAKEKLVGAGIRRPAFAPGRGRPVPYVGPAWPAPQRARGLPSPPSFGRLGRR